MVAVRVTCLRRSVTMWRSWCRHFEPHSLLEFCR